MAKIIGGIVVVVLVVGAYILWQGQRAVAPTDSMQPMQGVESEAASETMMDKGKQMVSSIKDAMGLGKAMQCTYAMDQDGKAMQSTVLVEGQKFKSMTTMDGMEVYGVFDGENQYSWTSASKVGMKMSKACLDKMAASAKDMATTTSESGAKAEDMRAAFDVAKNVQCEAAGMVDFTLPKDVTFTDQCAMMEESMKMMEQMKDKMPAGMTLPTQPNMAY